MGDRPVIDIEGLAVTRLFTPVDLALFSAATWNPHLIHLDSDAARRDGLPGVVAQSHFLPAALLAAVDDALGGAPAVLTTVEWRNHAPVLAGAEARFELDPPRASEGRAPAREWRAIVDGQTVADGTLAFVVGSCEVGEGSGADEED